jgi:hypothetical protein
MAVCDGEPLAAARRTQPDLPQPAQAEISQSDRLAALRLRAERARQEALVLCAWSKALIQPDAPGQELLTVSPLSRLRARLVTMPVIEQAKGVLISQQGCDADEAFELLRRASQRSNVPVRVLAEQIMRAARQASGHRQEEPNGRHQANRRTRPHDAIAQAADAGHISSVAQ